MVRRTRDKTQTSTGQPTRRRLTRAAKAIAASPPSRIRGVQVVQSVRDVPHQSPLVGSWPLGWSELPCVCVFQLGLWAGEARQGTVGVRGRPEDLLEPGVSALLQQILTEGDPMTLGSCTPGSQRRGTCA